MFFQTEMLSWRQAQRAEGHAPSTVEINQKAIEVGQIGQSYVVAWAARGELPPGQWEAGQPLPLPAAAAAAPAGDRRTAAPGGAPQAPASAPVVVEAATPGPPPAASPPPRVPMPDRNARPGARLGAFIANTGASIHSGVNSLSEALSPAAPPSVPLRTTDPTSGEVLLDGHPIATFPAAGITRNGFSNTAPVAPYTPVGQPTHLALHELLVGLRQDHGNLSLIRDFDRRYGVNSAYHYVQLYNEAARNPTE